MKETLALINDHDNLNARIAGLLAVRDMIIGPHLAAKISGLKADRGFAAVSAQGKELWLRIQKEFGPATEAVLLVRLCEANVTMGDFLAAFASPEGAGSVRRALEIVTAPKPSASRHSMPVDWRN